MAFNGRCHCERTDTPHQIMRAFKLLTTNFTSNLPLTIPPQLQLQASTPTKLSLFPYCVSKTNASTLTPHCSDNPTLRKEDDGEEEKSDLLSGDGFCIEIEKIGKNSRRIRSKIEINSSLAIVWRLLTSYDNLADFIPGLAVSQLIEKKGNVARLYQIGQQNLPLGFKFNAKAILDCYEKDLEVSAYGEKRDIEFKMIEGDFQLFEGKWSIEQFTKPRSEDSDISSDPEFDTVLSYFVDVKPKLWLPVHLVEGILCKEIKSNLLSIQEEAENLRKATV